MARLGSGRGDMRGRSHWSPGRAKFLVSKEHPHSLGILHRDLCGAGGCGQDLASVSLVLPGCGAQHIPVSPFLAQAQLCTTHAAPAGRYLLSTQPGGVLYPICSPHRPGGACVRTGLGKPLLGTPRYTA